MVWIRICSVLQKREGWNAQASRMETATERRSAKYAIRSLKEDLNSHDFR
jgi:hypothetical protein